MELQSLTPEMAESFGLSDPRGVAVTSVPEDTPADRGGIRPGDVITHINGETVVDYYDALNRVASLQPGEEAVVTLIRGEEKLEREVVIGERNIPAND